jgi:hypothetical protein
MPLTWGIIGTGTQGFGVGSGDRFGVEFGEVTIDNSSHGTTGVRWINVPKAHVIKPYFPSDNEKLADIFEKKILLNTGSADEILHIHAHALGKIFVTLSAKDLAAFSQVSKSCYLIAKDHNIWKEQLSEFLPNVKCIANKLTSLSPEQQFKIIYVRIKDELKPYFAQYQKNKELALSLMGPNGKIAQALQHFQSLGGEEAIARGEGQAWIACADWANKKTMLTILVGNNYDGTDKSIDPNSQQGHCLTAIYGIPNLFNNQKKFEEVIYE